MNAETNYLDVTIVNILTYILTRDGGAKISFGCVKCEMPVRYTSSNLSMHLGTWWVWGSRELLRLDQI